ncbi:MAG: hypothetical protein A3H69_04510 [Candidatus Sungbacteria bacterium RIFCSPLOWO2_02_FULL_47_9]|uniref:Metal-dependent hydrolase n=1 Tax=Candidatus Sungbacteria bacterium RIFCSPHIGHO2_01_FULL_47_32 TaxID=1802264 RepID=A0A1G2K765_9BACT|nr:MAG: hypothetical protein UX72_C0001G0076 [Parcubacteria group bacterium GW2011_GWA2_47_10]OGZ95272.1 MAG: hypothetical protein A2633_06130 [Candidatus Sungbacteria bacterium RIFCSPHIGHO2_01_FULL_47_32]OGZ97991.1 MAG: hypothetical protein A3D57_02620 [Candidatus Sungbacteria bacterium RIFCSPHIGHO2_02_FULL_46_12]OHA06225.1 MAG: hypothetical protein A3A28_00125 [Candidatus Sungbacteria bacterium RIFCSPLOWO2_01_FULL_47_32]OHA11393.1 MAG: hypothetical protein A3H69_04510 [Candidatus Sungbacteria
MFRRTLRILGGASIAASLDMAMGIIIFYCLGGLFRQKVSLVGYGIAMLMAVLPDLDVIIQLARERRSTGEHKKSITHYPMAMIPAVMAVAWFLSPFLSLAGALCLFWHYLHDSIGEGPGISWFAPFSFERYMLRKERDGWHLRLTPEELNVLYSANTEKWLEENYLCISAKSVFGVAALVTALALVLI